MSNNKNNDFDANDLAESVQVVYFYRMRSLSDNFPLIKQGNMSDEEYLGKLQEQYLALRTLNYEYAVKAQGYDMYNFSRNITVDKCKAYLFQKTNTRAEMLLEENSSLNESNKFIHTNPNDSIWQANANSAIFSASKVVDGSKRGVHVGEQVTKSDLPHCAQTAACIITATCGMLGLKDVTDGSDVCNAAHIHGGVCVSKNRFVNNRRVVGFGGDKYSHAEDFNGGNGKTLGQLIKSGKIKPGAIISEYVGGRTGSKMHALTIIEIKKNENGDVVGYTVMDNNGGKVKTRIRECKISLNGEGVDKVSFECNNKKVVYTNVANWAKDQFEAEMRGKSIEELQAMIGAEKDGIKETIKSLGVAEKTLLCDATYKNKCGKNRRVSLEKQQASIISNYNEYANMCKAFFIEKNGGYDINSIYKTEFVGLELGEIKNEIDTRHIGYLNDYNVIDKGVKKKMKGDNIRANMTIDKMLAKCSLELEKNNNEENNNSEENVSSNDKETKAKGVENGANEVDPEEYKIALAIAYRKKVSTR